MAARDSSAAVPKSTSFGALLRALRGDETQAQLARRLNFSRSAVGNIETGTPPGPDFVDALVALVPAHRAAILAAYAELGEQRRPPARKPDEAPVRRRIRRQLDSGRLEQAARAIDHELRHQPEIEFHLWLLGRRASLARATGDTAREADALQTAIRLADEHDHHNADRLRARLAAHHQRAARYADALALIDAALPANPDSARLWRRRGIVQWYDGQLPEAYASLSTALMLGFRRHSILHARGQVLAEWGAHAAAIDELTEVIEHAGPMGPVSRAYARSARAYAIAQGGDLPRALTEFRTAEDVIPESGWLHYFRALAYLDAGQPETAERGLRRALACEGTRLNPVKAERARELLGRLG